MGNLQVASFSRFLFPDRKTSTGTISLAIFKNIFTCTTVQIFVDFLQIFPSTFSGFSYHLLEAFLLLEDDKAVGLFSLQRKLFCQDLSCMMHAQVLEI